MRLLGINENDQLSIQLRAIFNGQPSPLIESVKNKDFLPLSYLFIESVIAINILDEGSLGDTFTAGLAKLKSALTPGSSEDLDMLLQFMAPRGGGAKAVNNLVQIAGREHGSILDNSNWWQELYNVFGVTDQTIQTNVLNQVKQEIAKPASVLNQPTEPAPPAPAAPAEPAPAAPAEPPAPAAPIFDQPQPGQPNSDLLNTLRQERDSEQAYQGDIAQQLTAIRKQRGITQKEIGHLRNRLERALQSGEPAAESVSTEIALVLMNETAVIRNITTINHHMIRQISIRCQCNAPILSEAGLMNRLRGAVKGAGNVLANPQSTRQRLRTTAATANNTRAAKLAVQLFSDQLRSTFEMSLQQAEITPDQIAQKLEIWNKLKQLEAKSRGNPSPKLVNAMVNQSQELKKIFKLFNHVNKKSGFEYQAPAPAPAAPAAPAWTGSSAPAPAPTPQSTSFNKRQRAFISVASIATGTKVDAQSALTGMNGYFSRMTTDDGWARLMNNHSIRRVVEQALKPYRRTVDSLSIENRKVLLKQIFQRIAP